MPHEDARHLNLWKKQLGCVPDYIWQQTELETLVLADNGLSEVSEQIGRLKTLRMLDLGHNELTRVPEALGDLDGLTDFLYLHDNRLTSLPSSLGRLTKLRYLNISENSFTALPEAVSGMANLIELRASGNQMTAYLIPWPPSRRGYPPAASRPLPAPDGATLPRRPAVVPVAEPDGSGLVMPLRCRATYSIERVK